MNERRFETQVAKGHYEFERYITRERWSSLWHQLHEVSRLKPRSVLEIGPGPGLFKMIAAASGISVETVDVDSELHPDHVASVVALPMASASYDVVCAFQVLEHLPYDTSLGAFREMTRVSRGHVVISLPDARRVWPYRVHIPKVGVREFLVPRPFSRAKTHQFDGEHYWEVNKRSYPLSRIAGDLSQSCKLMKSYRVPGNPHHRMFVFQR